MKKAQVKKSSTGAAKTTTTSTKTVKIGKKWWKIHLSEKTKIIIWSVVLGVVALTLIALIVRNIYQAGVIKGKAECSKSCDKVIEHQAVIYEQKIAEEKPEPVKGKFKEIKYDLGRITKVYDLKFNLDIYVPNPIDVEIAPLRAFRGEEFVFLDFGEFNHRVFHLGLDIYEIIDGLEKPVKYGVVDGRFAVIETGAGGNVELVLRTGEKLVCIKRTMISYGTLEDFSDQERQELSLKGSELKLFKTMRKIREVQSKMPKYSALGISPCA